VDKGTYKGRERGSKELKEDFLAKYPEVVKHLKKGQSIRNIITLAGISLGTLQKVKGLLV
jgi:uncharacterized protein YerC